MHYAPALDEDVTYEKNTEKIFTIGFTDAKIDEKYNFYSKNVNFDRNEMELSSKDETQIKDNKFNLYKTIEFIYFVNDELLKGNNVEITTNINLPSELSDKYFFSSGFFDLKDNNFNAAYPVPGPKDILGGTNIDTLDNDLKASALKALKVNREDCLEFAKKYSWEETAKIFFENISPN